MTCQQRYSICEQVSQKLTSCRSNYTGNDPSSGAVLKADAAHHGCGDSETVSVSVLGWLATALHRATWCVQMRMRLLLGLDRRPYSARMTPTTTTQEASRLVFVSVKDAKPRRQVLSHPLPTPTHLVRVVGPAHLACSMAAT